MKKIPIIDVTDLYHISQDPGDNVDLIAAYGLPKVDLKAVILDCTERFREIDHTGSGPRDPGIVPVEQLNYIFDRRVPFGVGPFRPMSSVDDALTDVPKYQQSGIQLLLETLDKSETPVQINSFGSARTIAASYLREPELMKRKVARVNLSAGSAEPTFLEHNVMLDPHAIVVLLRSELNIDVYPCGTAGSAETYGAFVLHPGNTYWLQESLDMILDMDPRLQQYLIYALKRLCRNDFLRFLELEPNADDLLEISKHRHHWWEQAIWMGATGMRLVQGPHEARFLMPGEALDVQEALIPDDLIPCAIHVEVDGRFAIDLKNPSCNRRAYFRADPLKQQSALRVALPKLYQSFLREGSAG